MGTLHAWLTPGLLQSSRATVIRVKTVDHAYPTFREILSDVCVFQASPVSTVTLFCLPEVPGRPPSCSR